ncbi:MAG: hypothetical protein DLM58_13760 [Pseudonocardiales bacterium]|nr:MAG: hypothetical protein DLM58_13760 [Pseudonocardiales bacterium]
MEWPILAGSDTSKGATTTVTEPGPTTMSHPHTARTLLVWGTLALALALSACGSAKPTRGGTSTAVPGTSSGTSAAPSGDTSAAPGTVDQCSVLIAGDLRAALGVAPIEAGTPKEGLTGPFCLWKLPNSDSFTVEIGPYVSPAEAERVFESLLTSVHQGGTPVAGLGDKADFTTGELGANFSDILVLTGRSILHLRHNAHAAPIAQATLTELANKALEQVK